MRINQAESLAVNPRMGDEGRPGEKTPLSTFHEFQHYHVDFSIQENHSSGINRLVGGRL